MMSCHGWTIFQTSGFMCILNSDFSHVYPSCCMQGRSYIGGAGGAAPPLAISQSANQVKVTLSRQIEKIPEICTLS